MSQSANNNHHRSNGSSKARFQSIPVDPSILDYIESVGVGRPKRTKRKIDKLRKTKRGQNTRKKEQAYLEQKASQTRRHVSRSRNGKESSSENNKGSMVPPVPFQKSSSKDKDTTIAGYRVRRHPVKVLGSAASMDEPFPKSTKGVPEVALAGRSNVGKSTLLNALLYGNTNSQKQNGDCTTTARRRRQKAGLPRGVKATVSDRPGETRQVTMYQLSSDLILGDAKHEASMVLVDLPGYGFAYASPKEATKWQHLMQHYLVSRGNKALKRVLLLLDARHGMKRADNEFLQQLESILYGSQQVGKDLPPIQMVLTKCDLVSREDLARRVRLVQQQLSNALRRETSMLPVMLTSARDAGFTSSSCGSSGGGGILELQRELAALVPLPKPNRNEPPRTRAKR